MSFWSFTFQIDVYIINHLTTSVMFMHTPFEIFFLYVPNYSKLRVFVCLCHMWLRPYNINKLESRPHFVPFLACLLTKVLINALVPLLVDCMILVMLLSWNPFSLLLPLTLCFFGLHHLPLNLGLKLVASQPSVIVLPRLHLQTFTFAWFSVTLVSFPS